MRKNATPSNFGGETLLLYWAIGGWTAIRQGQWRAVKPPGSEGWELYDLANDPSESKNLAAAQPGVVATVAALATQAHEPVREGTLATMVRASSENTANQKFARNAIAGDATTLWHTRFTGTVAPPPHELVIDLGAERTVRGFVYLGRQDAGWNGAIQGVEFCVSAIADKFSAPVAKAALAKSKEPQTITCPEVKGRSVLLRALTEHGDKTFASVAELGILGE